MALTTDAPEFDLHEQDIYAEGAMHDAKSVLVSAAGLRFICAEVAGSG
jgi:hypothetical protein